MLGRNVLVWGRHGRRCFLQPSGLFQCVCITQSHLHWHLFPPISAAYFNQINRTGRKAHLLIRLWILYYDQVPCFLGCTQARIPWRQEFCHDNPSQAPRSALWPWGHDIKSSAFVLLSSFTSRRGQPHLNCLWVQSLQHPNSRRVSRNGLERW